MPRGQESGRAKQPHRVAVLASVSDQNPVLAQAVEDFTVQQLGSVTAPKGSARQVDQFPLSRDDLTYRGRAPTAGDDPNRAPRTDD